MKPLKVVLMQAVVCLCLYSICTAWYFNRRLNQTDASLMQTNIKRLPELQNNNNGSLSVYLIEPNYEKQPTPKRKPNKRQKNEKIRTLFVKKDDKQHY